MARGGKRPGAGRPSGSENRDTAARRAALADLMGAHVQTAITALSEIAQHGETEGARVSAACAILDRCYGRPAQALQHEGVPPSGPTRIEIVPASVAGALDGIAARLSSSALQEIVQAQDAAQAERGE